MSETKTAPFDPNSAEQKSSPGDVTLRALTKDGAFRVIVARMTDTVRGIVKAQKVLGTSAEALGDLITTTVLFRETMAPNLRVQGIFKSGDGATLIADSAPEGKTRGLALLKGKKIEATGGGLLQMMRTLKNGSVNQGVVELKVGENMSKGAMTYMTSSEQVDSMIAVATTLSESGEVLEAGGFMVQLLPEVGRGPLAIMTERLQEFENIAPLLKDNFSPEWFMDEILYAMPFDRTDKSKVAFSCWCSTERMLGALASLPKSELQSMVDDGAPVEIDCDYCNREYRIVPAQLAGLLSPS